jgi:hypothetical protein
MRFVKIEPHGKFSLTKNFVNNFPEYAILSRTWLSDGDDQDVIYQDFENDVVEKKPGYRKLVFCAKQAMADGCNISG